MRVKFASMLVVAGSLVAAQSAMAADMPTKAPVYKAPAAAVAANWSGIYAGIHGGWARADWDHNFNDAGHYNLLAGDSFAYSKSGSMAGGHIGANYMFAPNWLVGIEGTWSKTWLADSNVISPFFPATDLFSSDVKWIATVVGRLGMTSGNWLFYGKGGAAWARIKDRIEDTADFVEVNRTVSGWTAGAGVEYQFLPNWIVGVDYNYYRFKNTINQEALLLGTNTPAGVFTNHELKTEVQSAVVRLSHKFFSR